MRRINYSDFVKNFDNYKGCSFRIVGIMKSNNKEVKSCWRKANFCDLAEKPSSQIMMITGVEIA